MIINQNIHIMMPIPAASGSSEISMIRLSCFTNSTANIRDNTGLMPQIGYAQFYFKRVLYHFSMGVGWDFITVVWILFYF